MEAEGDQIVYDLHIYDWSDETCTDLPVTRDACADRALAAVTSDYDPGSGTLTLSYGDTSAVYRFPEQYRQSPGRMSFATSFFREQNGVFTVILGARAESTGAWFANVLADIEYDGADFTLPKGWSRFGRKQDGDHAGAPPPPPYGLADDALHVHPGPLQHGGLHVCLLDER